jgi:hypothetical protein
MNRSHGPAFRAPLIPLDQCPVCLGKTFIEGVFHQIACNHCNASGWVDATTGQALPLETLAMQLGRRLRQSSEEVQEMRRSMPGRGAAEQYNQNNRRGAGGSNFTGD